MGGGGVVFYDFSDPLRPVAMSEVDRLLDPSTYSASNSYSVGALSAVFGREADTPSNLFPAIFFVEIDDPAVGNIVLRKVIASMSVRERMLVTERGVRRPLLGTYIAMCKKEERVRNMLYK